MDVTKRIGLEDVARAALVIFYNGINDAIDNINARYGELDPSFWAQLGREDPGYSVEHIESTNVYPGHVPSLIAAPIDKYPNLAVLAYTATPEGSSDDWAEMYRHTLGVEIMVKSQVSEEEVNARIHRTVEAAHECLTSDRARSLDGLTLQLDGMPTVTVGDVFIRQEVDEALVWYWQGARLEYGVEKLASY